MSLRTLQGLCFGARAPARLFSTAIIARQRAPPAGAAGTADAADASNIDSESGRPYNTAAGAGSSASQGSARGPGAGSYPIKASLDFGFLPKNPELERLRVVPTLPTFYGGNPVHEDNMNQLNAVLRKHINLPTRVLDAKTQQSQKRFISFEEYKERLQAGTRLKPMHHKELTTLLHRLRSIEPELMPAEVAAVLQSYTHTGSVLAQRATRLPALDEYGRSVTYGKRKTSTARVYLARGDGEFVINGRSFMDYFPLDKQRARINYPFATVAQEGRYNVFVEVVGGGIGGQCEAVMYGIAKGLVVHNPLLKSRLHAAGLMTRDTRKVERKKPGKLKARKMPAWVKR